MLLTWELVIQSQLILQTPMYSSWLGYLAFIKKILVQFLTLKLYEINCIFVFLMQDCVRKHIAVSRIIKIYNPNFF